MFLILRKAIQLPLELIAVPHALLHVDFPKQWLKLALFSLMLSGFFSFIIVLARTPGLAELIGDPLFARKSLVLHVDYALVFWFYAFLAALYLSLVKNIKRFSFSIGLRLALGGSILMIFPLFSKSADPILANYIPVLDHPLFLTGLMLIAAGLVMTFSGVNSGMSLDKSSSGRPSFYSDTAAQTIHLAGVVIVIAIFTFVASFIITPEMASITTYYELVMWGGGHILQFANVLGMLTVWMILIRKLTGRELITPKKNRWLISILAIPVLLSPILLVLGTTSQLYYTGFTHLMRWFIFPVVSIYILIGIHSLWKFYMNSTQEQSLFKNLYFNAFFVSVLLTVTGFILGAMIRGSNTLIPAHYHASLGGVTVAYMAMVFIMMREYGFKMTSPKGRSLTSFQPLLFGVGQTLFVIGFAIAGMTGMGRKLFGQDQSIYSTEALFGLGFMSIGGLLAMTGGVLFIYIVTKSYKNGQAN